MGYRMINGRAYPVGVIGDINKNNLPNVKKSNNTSFKDLLDSKIKNKSFTVSKHAAERLKDINFSENDMNNIEKGFKLAEDKGSKNSLFLYKDVALVTSVENKTVITAVDKSRAKDNVFTNIDSVVII